ncbi:hypothetical protein Cgig2_006811 [Carnegiea gigantea]|uniref:Uncharacterized protein n=1 Tax=Carnegiea gigantea TaxID=171969 RepID=A0A9Q1JPM7_9CARY|nr:hypothetical protein Cgig2_006811 [Carnegiea gigantea]
MVNCVETEGVFFDAVNHHLLGEADSNAHRVLLRGEFWRSDLRSVKEWRESFLHEMDLLEDLCPSFECASDHSLGMESERSEERSNGAVVSSCSSSSIDRENSSVEFYARNCNGNANSVVVDEWGGDTEPSPSMSLGEKHRVIESIYKRLGQWWKEIISKQKKCKCQVEKGDQPKKPEISRMKTQVHKKKFKGFTAMFTSQGIRAHKGIIRTMKFSPDGKYLASGGEDGVVKVWRVTSVDFYIESLQNESGFGKEKKRKAQVVIPDKMFKIEEQPLHEFRSHVGDILDLAWSSSNVTSMDRTVCLWQIGSDECLSIFHHTSYVTCVQFNPMDNHSFISGSIDGKVRVWGVLTGWVLDWADVGNAVTAVCYQPDGRGFVVGSLGGTCRSMKLKVACLSSQQISLFTVTESHPPTGSKAYSFLQRALRKSWSRAKIPNSEYLTRWMSPVNTKVYPLHYPGMAEPRLKGFNSHSNIHKATSQTHHPPGFFRSNLFTSRSCATWPSDMLPVFNPLQSKVQAAHKAVLPLSWGLMVITGNRDGMIQTFCNYGLPVGV